ncbi:LuxR C-terminal-related transcriptional regulator [Chloroflexota bacterium]
MISRPKLIQKLNAGLAGKLTLVSAPAGYGKTTALCEWIRSTKVPVCWISVDAGDNDPARFWAYVIAALQTIEPTAGKAAEKLIKSRQQLPIEAILTSLINDISADDAELIMVLDDYYLIELEAIHKAISFFIDHLPPQLHLVIAGRSDPPLPLANLRAKGLLSELRTADLRFTPQEASDFLKLTTQTELSDNDILQLEERTEGWIASLQMAALSLKGRDDVSGFINSFSGSHRYILDYLTEEVLRRQDEPTRAFLLKTSIVDHLCGPMCDALTKRDDGQKTLEQLDEANLFVQPLDDKRYWYRYHRLFTDLLRNQLIRTYPGDIHSLHFTAAKWYEENGYVQGAMHHAFAMNNYEYAADLIEQSAFNLLTEGKSYALQIWLAKLPKELVQSRPWLCIWGGWSYLMTTAQPGDIEPFLNNVDAKLPEIEQQPSDDTSKIKGYSLTLHAILARRMGDLTRSIELSHQASKYVSEDDQFARSFILLNLTVSYFYNGELEIARSYAEKTMAHARATETIYDDIVCTILMAQIESQQGNLAKAKVIFEEAVELGTQPRGYILPATCKAFTGLGTIAYEQNDLDDAESYYNKAIELAQQGNEILTVMQSQVMLAWLNQIRGNAQTADALFSKARSLALKSHMSDIEDYIESWKARFAMARGDLDTAQRWATEQKDALTAPDTLFYNYAYGLLSTLIRICISINKLDGILPILENAKVNLDRQGQTGWLTEVLAHESIVLDAMGDTEKALETLEQALHRAEPQSYIRLFVDQGEPMAKLLRLAASRGMHPAYVNKLRSAMHNQEQEQSDKQSQLIDPLSQRELEVLELLDAGKSNQQIADELILSIGTVKKHVYNIYSKLGVERRTQAISHARELGLI